MVIQEDYVEENYEEYDQYEDQYLDQPGQPDTEKGRKLAESSGKSAGSFDIFVFSHFIHILSGLCLLIRSINLKD